MKHSYQRAVFGLLGDYWNFARKVDGFADRQRVETFATDAPVSSFIPHAIFATRK